MSPEVLAQIVTTFTLSLSLCGVAKIIYYINKTACNIVDPTDDIVTYYQNFIKFSFLSFVKPKLFIIIHFED